MSRIIDISPAIDASIAVWPGDVGFKRELSMDMTTGDHMTLSAIRTTVHVGAHTDAPNHYLAQGQGIGERDLSYYYGPCQIISVQVSKGERIVPEHVQVAVGAERVLFHTGSYPNPKVFNEDFCSLSPELVEYLTAKGVKLVGIDTPSVDPHDDDKMLSHKAIAAANMAILEGVVLQGVADGVYTLSALPLPLRDADASPVRAVLIEDT
jgi:arylformamidase